MQRLFWLGITLGLLIWVVVLRRRVMEARQHTTMYREIALRLERKLNNASAQES
jgi:type IV secretory pathway TrbD component